jgi:hypothetical protein
MNKKQQILALSIVAIIAVIFYAYSHNKAGLPVSDTSASSSYAFSPRTEETDAYSVSVSYPSFSESLPGAHEANAIIKKDIDARVASFEKEAEESFNSDIGLPKDIKSTVTGSPAIEDENDRYVSLFFGAEWYVRGAAHPYHTINTYIFDKKLGTIAGVTDIFKSNTEYLAFLSHYSYGDLVSQSETGDTGFTYDKDMLKEGTEGTYDNFHLMLPTKDGLMVYFTEYRVAPYAAGPQQVAIPYAKLKDFINPDGVLGMYIK